LATGIWSVFQTGDWAVTGFTVLFTALATGFVGALVWFLWTRAWWVAEKLVPDNASYSRWPHVRAVDLEVVAFSTVGLFALVNNIQSLARSFGLFIGVLNSDRFGERRITLMEWLTSEGALGSIAGCVLGLWLVVGSRGLVRLIRRLRRPEFHEPVDEPIASRGTVAEGVQD
jgi:hypothetical protein